MEYGCVCVCVVLPQPNELGYQTRMNFYSRRYSIQECTNSKPVRLHVRA